jgi:uncharacterized membrane protein YqjE
VSARSLGDELSGAFAGARGLLANLLDLFTLEARHAGLAFILMLGCAGLGALLAASAWLGLMAVFAIWAMGLGMTWQAVFGVLAAASLALAAALFWLCVRVSRELLFPATRRQLHGTRRALA